MNIEVLANTFNETVNIFNSAVSDYLYHLSDILLGKRRPQSADQLKTSQQLLLSFCPGLTKVGSSQAQNPVLVAQRDLLMHMSSCFDFLNELSTKSVDVNLDFIYNVISKLKCGCDCMSKFLSEVYTEVSKSLPKNRGVLFYPSEQKEDLSSSLNMTQTELKYSMSVINEFMSACGNDGTRLISECELKDAKKQFYCLVTRLMSYDTAFSQDQEKCLALRDQYVSAFSNLICTDAHSSISLQV